jgi:hypothetical protein
VNKSPTTIGGDWWFVGYHVNFLPRIIRHCVVSCFPGNHPHHHPKRRWLVDCSRDCYSLLGWKLHGGDSHRHALTRYSVNNVIAADITVFVQCYDYYCDWDWC